jgi:hypothetical protein
VLEELTMNKVTLNFVNASADVSVIDNLIYISVSGIYTDEVALKLIQYLEELFVRIPDSPIRVWDASGVSAGAFQLSSQCIDKIATWGRQLKTKKPGSVAYMMGSNAVSYGMARMYGIKADLEGTGVIVLRSIDELPPAIKEKLPI